MNAAIKFHNAAELTRTLKPPTWLIRDWLPEHANALLYGKSEHGKSFVAVDWACCVASGTPWMGIPVKKGDVLYLAGEGEHGYVKRVAAWQQAHPDADIS